MESQIDAQIIFNDSRFSLFSGFFGGVKLRRFLHYQIVTQSEDSAPP